jgi:hypothetical protein
LAVAADGEADQVAVWVEATYGTCFDLEQEMCDIIFLLPSLGLLVFVSAAARFKLFLVRFV